MGDARNIEKRFLGRAIALARRAEGDTAPNPMVGCVVVKDGSIVGEGWHKGAGEPHAEVEALRDAGPNARGGVAYVTLEPCNHHGRTPPCTQALLSSGVARVVYGMADENATAAGGAAFLSEQGVETIYTDVCANELAELNRFWLSRIRRGRPYVIVKVAMSLDGRIATRTGDSQWITGPAARDHAHIVRKQVDAIIVGAETVIADDPSLTARQGDDIVGNPLRVALDATGRTPPGAAMFDRAGRGALLFSTEKAPEARLNLYREHGVAPVVTPSDHLGRPDVRDVLAALYERGVSGVLVEGGGAVHASFLKAGLVDEIHAYIAPRLIGGDGRPAIASLDADVLGDAFEAAFVESHRLGDDILMVARLNQEAEGR